MTIEQNKEIVRRIVDECWNPHDVPAFARFYAPEVVNHDPVAPAVMDLQGLGMYATMLFAAFPDFHVEIDQMVAEGDMVSKSWTVTGTQLGEFQGIPATGKAIRFTGITLYRIAGEKVVENWWSYDMLGLMQQLGAIPMPA